MLFALSRFLRFLSVSFFYRQLCNTFCRGLSCSMPSVRFLFQMYAVRCFSYSVMPSVDVCRVCNTFYPLLHCFSVFCRRLSRFLCLLSFRTVCNVLCRNLFSVEISSISVCTALMSSVSVCLFQCLLSAQAVLSILLFLFGLVAFFGWGDAWCNG